MKLSLTHYLNIKMFLLDPMVQSKGYPQWGSLAKNSPWCNIALFAKVHREECMHLGYDKGFGVMSQRFYRYNMYQDLLDRVRACASCQQNKKSAGGSRNEPKQDISGHPMVRIAIYLQGPSPCSSQGIRYILVVQDYFSKWIELFPLPRKDADEVARTFHDEILTRYGYTRRLYTDKGKEFNNQVLDADP